MQEENENQKLNVIDKRKLQNLEEEEDPILQDETKDEDKHTSPPIRRVSMAHKLLMEDISNQARKDKNTKEISCPTCKYRSSNEEFLFNKQNTLTICPRCGVCFIQSIHRIGIMAQIDAFKSGIIVPQVIPGKG